MHTRHVHLTAPWRCRQIFETTTVEKADAGTLGRHLGSLGFPVREGSSHLNVGHIPVYSNVKFAPASLLRHPRRDVMYSTHILMLVGKVYLHVASEQ